MIWLLSLGPCPSSLTAELLEECSVPAWFTCLRLTHPKRSCLALVRWTGGQTHGLFPAFLFHHAFVVHDAMDHPPHPKKPFPLIPNTTCPSSLATQPQFLKLVSALSTLHRPQPSSGHHIHCPRVSCNTEHWPLQLFPQPDPCVPPPSRPPRSHPHISHSTVTLNRLKHAK